MKDTIIIAVLLLLAVAAVSWPLYSSWDKENHYLQMETKR